MSTSGTSSKGKVKLEPSDKEIFEVEKSLVKKWHLVQTLIECCVIEDRPIRLDYVSGKTLAKIIEYSKYHAEHDREHDQQNPDGKPVVSNTIKQWDANFVKVDHTTLLGLIKASNYLNFANLLDLTCHAVADKIVNKTPEEIRKTFNIVNIPEEEEQIRKENHWAFQQLQISRTA